VLARDRGAATASSVPASSIKYEYGVGVAVSAGVLLGNSASGAVGLFDGSTTIANVAYGGWYTTQGESIQLRTLTSAAGPAKSSWCVSSNAWTTGSDKGTPGAANDCP